MFQSVSQITRHQTHGRANKLGPVVIVGGDSPVGKAIRRGPSNDLFSLNSINAKQSHITIDGAGRVFRAKPQSRLYSHHCADHQTRCSSGRFPSKLAFSQRERSIRVSHFTVYPAVLLKVECLCFFERRGRRRLESIVFTRDLKGGSLPFLCVASVSGRAQGLAQPLMEEEF